MRLILFLILFYAASLLTDSALAVQTSLAGCELYCETYDQISDNERVGCRVGCSCDESYTNADAYDACISFCAIDTTQDIPNEAASNACFIGCQERNLCRSQSASVGNCNTFCSDLTDAAACNDGCDCTGDVCYLYCDDTDLACKEGCLYRGICPAAFADTSIKGGLQLTAKSVPLITNHTVMDAYSDSGASQDDYTDAFISTREPDLSLSWRYDPLINAAYNASAMDYSLDFSVSDEGILSSITPSIALSGRIPDVDTTWNLDFTCTTYATVTITIAMTLTAAYDEPAYTETLLITFNKDCFPNSCDTPLEICADAPCQTDSNGVDYCACDSGYNHTALCDFGLFTDMSSYCPNDAITITWDWLHSGSATSDWMSVIRPLPSDPMRIRTAGELAELVGTSHEATWAFLQGKQILESQTGQDPWDTGSWTWKLNNEISGRYYVLYFQRDTYDLKAMTSFVLNPIDSVECVIPDTLLNCSESDHGIAVLAGENGYCDCDDGFFGANCEHGCAAATILTDWGTRLGSYVTTDNAEYANNVMCSWQLSPSHDVPVTGYSLQIRDLTMDPFDNIAVYSGTADQISEESLIARYPGMLDQSTPRTLQLPGETEITIVFTTNDNFASWPQMGYYGWQLDYFALGCPPGSAIQFNQTSENYDCSPCPAGTYSDESDTLLECLSCPFHTYSDEGSTECVACDKGFFHPYTNGTQCLPCSQYNYPDPCPEDPELTDAQAAAVWASVGVAFTLMIGTAVMLVVFKKNKVIFTASPLFLWLMLIGLCIGLVASLFNTMHQTRFICNIKIWFTTLAFQVFFAPLFAKTYRLHRIFNNPLLRAVTITNGTLLQIVAIFVGIDIVIMAVWSGLSPYEITDAAFPICRSEDGVIFKWIIFILQAITFCFGLYLTYKLRNVPSLYNESGWIALAMYNTVGVLAIFGVLTNVNTDDNEAEIMFYFSLLMVYECVSVVFILFGPKAYFIRMLKRAEELKYQRKNDPSTAKTAIKTKLRDVEMNPIEMSGRELKHHDQNAVVAQIASALTDKDGSDLSRNELKERIATEVKAYSKIISKIERDEELLHLKEDRLALMQAHFLYLCNLEGANPEETAADAVFNKDNEIGLESVGVKLVKKVSNLMSTSSGSETELKMSSENAQHPRRTNSQQWGESSTNIVE